MLPQRPPLDWRREYLPIRQRYSERPNILGYSNIAGYYDLATASGGALSACSRWTFSIVREPGTAGGIINIDASGANSIYGASTTNQPKSLRAYALIRYE